MKLEQIPGDYDNVDQRALELAEYMRDYIKELYANIHMRDSISGEEPLQILNKVAPWNMMAN